MAEDTAAAEGTAGAAAAAGATATAPRSGKGTGESPPIPLPNPPSSCVPPGYVSSGGSIGSENSIGSGPSYWRTAAVLAFSLLNIFVVRACAGEQQPSVGRDNLVHPQVSTNQLLYCPFEGVLQINP